jgi:hypothetical protein
MWPCINFGNGRPQSGVDARIHLALLVKGHSCEDLPGKISGKVHSRAP